MEMLINNFSLQRSLASSIRLSLMFISTMLIIIILLFTEFDNVDGQFFTKTSKSIPRLGRKVDNSLIMELLDDNDVDVNDGNDLILSSSSSSSATWNHQEDSSQQQQRNQTNLLYRLFMQMARLFRQSPHQ
ncbi:hypothetical protein DERF_013128 [Dermatophagoides farinae]|uniref:Uncharacterized protein n=1 Tax=Dermatophagoides farinae TaxID=6954 RepID=A0A922HNV4_DERFA|nr:hypothetical protein DERF_013128 [Dermatophagoides farinae]